MSNVQTTEYLPSGGHFYDGFPLAPQSVKNAYGYHSRVTHGSQISSIERQRDLGITNTYMSDFCDEYLPPQTYTAAMLSPFTEVIDDPILGRNSMRALKVYRQTSDETEEEKRYVFGLITDPIIIKDFWNRITQDHYRDEPHRLALLADQLGRLDVPDYMWEQPVAATKPSDILKLRTESGVNIETFLIRAARTLQKLDIDNAPRNALTLQNIHLAESLYSPMCETIGFDGVAMALQSQSQILRQKFSNRDQYQPLAREIIENMGDPQTVERRAQVMLESMLGANSHRQVLDHTAQHGIIIGEGLCTDEALRVVWRRKSFGSLARKLEISNGRPPMDIIAATVIVNDEAQIGRVLRDVYERAQNDPRVTLAPSQKRDKALHIKGDEEYIQRVYNAMGMSTRESADELIDIKLTDFRGYRVAKVTFKFQIYGEHWPLHCEIQFNTESDRREARVGGAAHAFSRLTDEALTKEDIEAAQEINRKKAHLGRLSLTPLSNKRGEWLEKKVDAIRFPN